jgi:hypothetical protein
MPPCGLPLRDGWYGHSSQSPAFRAPSINRKKRLSWMFSRRMFIRMAWSILSNEPPTQSPLRAPSRSGADRARSHGSMASAVRPPLAQLFPGPLGPESGLCGGGGSRAHPPASPPQGHASRPPAPPPPSSAHARPGARLAHPRASRRGARALPPAAGWPPLAPPWQAASPHARWPLSQAVSPAPRRPQAPPPSQSPSRARPPASPPPARLAPSGQAAEALRVAAAGPGPGLAGRRQRAPGERARPPRGQGRPPPGVARGPGASHARPGWPHPGL